MKMTGFLISELNAEAGLIMSGHYKVIIKCSCFNITLINSSDIIKELFYLTAQNEPYHYRNGVINFNLA